MRKREEKKKRSEFRLFKHIRRYIWQYVVALVAIISVVTITMIMPEITRHIVDDVIVGGKTELLVTLLGSYLLLGALKALLQYIKEYNFDSVSSKVVVSLRRDLFTHIQNLDTSYFDKNNTGEIMARLKEDIDKVWEALSFISMLLIEVILHTVFIIVCMIRLNAYMAIIPIMAIVFCGCLAIKMDKKLDKVFGDISEENAVLNTTCEENIAGVRTVKAFAKEKFEILKFRKHNDRYKELNVDLSRVFVKYYPFFSFVSGIVPLLVLVIGGIFYVKGMFGMTLGLITAYITYSNNIIWPMEMLGWLTNSFSEAVASVKKLNKIYEEVSTINDPEDPVVLDEVKGTVTFDKVGFHKEDMHDILKDISFEIPAGRTLGIMGASGAGKTSIVSLLTRLYDVTEGEIRLDGVPIKDLTLKQLRGNMSLVTQDVFLFSDTISENIKMGRRHRISDEVVRISSKNAGASEFIDKMDKGYETVIGERGVGLSGGQKQRISIARALAKELPILIMDDSTSALDMETERDIQKKLKELTNMTKIIIAHRISSVKDADEIIVLEEGRIAERGTHEELLGLKGLYYETYVSQYGIPELKEVI
ncbi:MAG: ABC transporter ATP-binding protein/permease [Lachnospiraceae bacterium]|nr:ABC transporter ATP-binding protein/permease [Lachnospiraceae bacterium]